ncbi:(2,3-dihydroxybenzoyl)adenylate synthase [Vibrio mangrovi]|uniref:(2,3-dihydroxybenzoyl)adenylate synthase n=1 Tax=Vibrio mangrovi TaxID=474394 RepID=A0A1Y6IW79_9VIBR|nr:(2,3-dihydroxybenzoyl)adenylate synthase [Vibrio mangrovi]MDW6003039.1 (2,3-dihydroxybenzoyl)adenylate synthase [Vibrio mangrovi]SMS01281.1 Enterobactin synthase component E [Vibrio mangrovi]
MTIPFTHWPEELAAEYRQQGYWLDRHIHQMITERRHEETPAVISDEQQLSYRQLAEKSDRLAAVLQSSGYGRGDTALVQLGNVAEFYICFFALLKAGIAPLNALFSHQRSELLAYAAQIKPRILIADVSHPLFAGKQFITELRENVPQLKTVLLRGTDDPIQNLSAQIELPLPASFQPTPTAPGDVAFFQLSGGSTGTPKLIPRTHNDYEYSVRRSVEICEFTSQTRYLCALPAAHNYPLSSPGALGVFIAGGSVCLAPDPSPTSCFDRIGQHQINTVALVPPALNVWLQTLHDYPVLKDKLTSLSLLQVGGAKLSESIARRVPSELGCQLQQVFGMAEGLVNYTRLNDPAETIFTTQGRPMSEGDELWVADDSGQQLPAGQVGRLMTRGPYTFRGYYNSQEHNMTSFDSQGFYCSGDLVSLDEQGNVTVHGREKDQINRGGEKIAAEEVENLLLTHPDIIHAALVSFDDDHLGEKSCAYLVTQTPLKAVAVRRHLRQQGIADYKLPDTIHQVDSLPLTAVGKVDKRALRQQLSQTQTLSTQPQSGRLI